jgi:hypothetical protein
MKSTYELTERETLAIVELAKHAIDALVRMRIVADDDFAEEENDTSAGDVDGADHFVPERDENVHEHPAPAAAARAAAAPEDVLAAYAGDKNARVVMPSAIRPLPAEHPLVREGRTAYFKFVEVWQQNFGIEGAEQPDRANLMRSTTATSAGPVLAYLRFKGGLIAGVLEFFADSEGNVSPEDQQRAIALATNIAQVGSVLAPEFTDMMEFVKPDGTFIPHVRYEQVRIPQE